MVANKTRTIRNGTQKKMSLKTFPGDFSEVELEFYEERAAILEFDGGMCRETAEMTAAKLALIFFGKAQ